MEKKKKSVSKQIGTKKVNSKNRIRKNTSVTGKKIVKTANSKKTTSNKKMATNNKKASIKVSAKKQKKNVKKTDKLIEPVEATEPNQEIKREKWYVWLKNNIIENEEKISKEDKNRRLFISMFAVLCFFVVLFSTAVIDYNYASQNDKRPLFVIGTRNEYKQADVYYGLFYKAWRCDNGFSKIVFGRYSSEITYCTLNPVYNEKGIYVNPNGVKITKSQMNIIKNYFYDEYVNFKTEQDLKDAYNISVELNKIWWVRNTMEYLIDDDESIGLAIFGKTKTVAGIETWELQYNNPEYYKCVKNSNGVNVFADYNYLDNTCDTYWRTLSLKKETCELAQNSTEFVKNLVTIAGFCK